MRPLCTIGLLGPRAGGRGGRRELGVHAGVCNANTAHKQGCNIEGCEFTFDEWVERAADDQHAKARELGLVP